MGDSAENKPEVIDRNENVDLSGAALIEGEKALDDAPNDAGSDVEIVIEGDEEPESETVPLAAHIALKKKLRGEKGQAKTLEQSNSEMQSQLKALQQENELYKLNLKQGEKAQSFTAPSRKQFTDEYGDFDADAYDSALVDYSRQVDAKIQEAKAHGTKALDDKFKAIESETANAAKDKKLDEILVSHAEQAESLGVKNYEESLSSVASQLPKGAYEALMMQGIVDAKTTVYLHKNPAKLQEVLTLASTVGEFAAISKLTEIKLKAKKRTAPAIAEPDAPTKGVKTAGSSDYQQLLDNLRSGGEYDVDKAIEIKRQAREAGVEVR